MKLLPIRSYSLGDTLPPDGTRQNAGTVSDTQSGNPTNCVHLNLSDNCTRVVTDSLSGRAGRTLRLTVLYGLFYIS